MRFILLLVVLLPSLCASERLRVIVETDAGGDPDDEQSLVRFLLYVNEWDVEAIIANRPAARVGENRNKERTGFGIVRQLIDAYGICWTNLHSNDPRYPTAKALHARTVAGYDDTEEGVNRIISAVDAPDPRPIWYSDWGTDVGGATNNLKRALDRVLRERGQEGYAQFKNKIRVIFGDTLLVDHRQRAPAWKLWVNTFQPPMDGKRWYHRFSGITATAGGFDLMRDVLTGHGPLGALYPTNTTHWQKEGDTMCFLYLVPTGMNDPNQPGWGSWAGRYGPREEFQNLPYYWANQLDAWNGATNRDNVLKRWATHLQNDFRARLDWCVKPFARANHPPRVALNADLSGEILEIKCKASSTVELDAISTTDPDGQHVDFDWTAYPEAGTYRGSVQVEPMKSRARVTVPGGAASKTIHIILIATDSGEPRLTRYRRAILKVDDR